MRILVLDDLEVRHAVIGKMLRRREHEVVHVYNYDDAVSALRGERFDEMYLDHDLECYVQEMYGSRELTGAHVAREITALPAEKHPARIVIHSWNVDGARNMRSILQEHCIPVVIQPFSDLWI